MEVTARLWWLPPAMAVTVGPAGRLTATGVVRSIMVPSPNSPWSFWPQARTAPVDVNAKLWSLPPAMAVTSAPTGRLTATGVVRLVVVPSPS